MSQFFGSENIAKLIKSGSTTVQLVAGSNIRVGGQFYKLANTLSCDLSTSGIGGLDTGSIAVHKLYMIYAVVNGSNQIELIASLNVNSVGPTGYISWKLVGALYTDDSSEIGSMVNIEGSPLSNSIGVTPIISAGFGTPLVNSARVRRVGDTLEMNGFIRAGTISEVTATIGLLSGLLISSSLSNDLREKIGDGNATKAASSDIATVINTDLAVFYDSGTSNSVVYLGEDLDSNASSNTFFKKDVNTFANTNGQIAYKFKVPISGWSNTPLKDL